MGTRPPTEGDLGAYEFKGKTYSAPEPKDVIVATDINGTNNENSRSWALKQILSGKATRMDYMWFMNKQ